MKNPPRAPGRHSASYQSRARQPSLYSELRLQQLPADTADKPTPDGEQQGRRASLETVAYPGGGSSKSSSRQSIHRPYLGLKRTGWTGVVVLVTVVVAEMVWSYVCAHQKLPLLKLRPAAVPIEAVMQADSASTGRHGLTS